MKIIPKLVNMIEVRDVLVLCSETEINDLLGCTFQTRHDLAKHI